MLMKACLTTFHRQGLKRKLCKTFTGFGKTVMNESMIELYLGFLIKTSSNMYFIKYFFKFIKLSEYH